MSSNKCFRGKKRSHQYRSNELWKHDCKEALNRLRGLSIMSIKGFLLYIIHTSAFFASWCGHIFKKTFVEGRARPKSRCMLSFETLFTGGVPRHAVKEPFNMASTLSLKDCKSLKSTSGKHSRKLHVSHNTDFFFFRTFIKCQHTRDGGQNVKWHLTSKPCQPGRPLALEWDYDKCLVPHYALPAQQSARVKHSRRSGNIVMCVQWAILTRRSGYAVLAALICKSRYRH